MPWICHLDILETNDGLVVRPLHPLVDGAVLLPYHVFVDLVLVVCRHTLLKVRGHDSEVRITHDVFPVAPANEHSLAVGLGLVYKLSPFVTANIVGANDAVLVQAKTVLLLFVDHEPDIHQALDEEEHLVNLVILVE